MNLNIQMIMYTWGRCSKPRST